MKLVISQPRVYPHITYLDKVARADLFVISDDLIPKKDLFEIRNRYWCRQSQSAKYLTITLESKVPFRFCRIRDLDQIEHHRSILRHNYMREPYFDMDLLNHLMPDPETDMFMDFFYLQFKRLCELFGITTPMSYSSKAGSQNRKTARLNDIIRYYGGTSYLSGVFGKQYIKDLICPVEYHDTYDARFNIGDRGIMLMIFDPLFRFGQAKIKEVLKC